MATTCSMHADVPAVIFCANCDSSLCATCIIAHKGLFFCSVCNRPVKMLELPKNKRASSVIAIMKAQKEEALEEKRRRGRERWEKLKEENVRKAEERAQRLALETGQAYMPPSIYKHGSLKSIILQPDDVANADVQAEIEAARSSERVLELPRDAIQRQKAARLPPFFCKKHADIKATRHCDRCRDDYCASCANMVRGTPFCPDCVATLHQLTHEEQGLPPKTSGDILSDSFAYPFKGEGSFILFFASILCLAFGYSVYTMIIAKFIMWFYLLKICRNSAAGFETPPYSVSMHEYGFIGCLLLAELICMLPPGLLLLTTNEARFLYWTVGADDGGPLCLLLFSFMSIIFPVMLLNLLVYNSVDVILPVRLVRCIGVFGAPYIFVVLLLWAANGVEYIKIIVLKEDRYLEAGFLSIAWLFIMMVAMRMMGDIHFINRKLLNAETPAA